ncbi:hypothetical protein ACLOJK_011820 [Asimina triloba]
MAITVAYNLVCVNLSIENVEVIQRKVQAGISYTKITSSMGLSNLIFCVLNVLELVPSHVAVVFDHDGEMHLLVISFTFHLFE